MRSSQNQETMFSESIILHASNPTVSIFLKYPTYVDQTQNEESRPKKKSRKEGEKKESSILKKIIKELSTDTFDISKVSEEVNVNSSNFWQLSNKINHAESKNEDATKELIKSYFNFGEIIYNQYKELKAIYGKVGTTTIVKDEFRKEISKIKFINNVLQKRKKRTEK
ncbi:8522_t:CDS:1, partial [Cetraspora pellucida]